MHIPPRDLTDREAPVRVVQSRDKSRRSRLTGNERFTRRMGGIRKSAGGRQAVETLKGTHVNLHPAPRAPKARSSTAQGGAQRNPGASGTFKMSPVRAVQKAAGFRMRHLLCCAALTQGRLCSADSLQTGKFPLSRWARTSTIIDISFSLPADPAAGRAQLIP